MNTLITGGAGFLGSNLAHFLVQKNHHVTVIDNFHPDYGSNEFNLSGITGKIRLVRNDINHAETIRELVSASDVIFHFAAQCSHVDSMTNPWLDLEFNCKGTLTILEAARLSQRKPIIIYCSTRAVIGQPLEMPATETTLPNPTDIYGVNKLAAEYYGAVYARVHGIPFISMRLTNCYGTRHQMRSSKYGILNWLISLALQGKPIKVFGTGEQLRDYLFAEDPLSAFLSVVEVAEKIRDKKQTFANAQIAGTHIPYAVFNVGSGKGVRFVDVAKKIVERTKASLEMVPWPADRKAIETGDFVFDGTVTSQILGWKQETSLEDGLDKTIQFYREYSKHYF